MYCKTNGNNFQIVESGGSKRGEYDFSDVTIYDDVNSGGAETFASAELLMKRLEALSYVGFYYDGDVISADLISTDASNGIGLGTDGKLFVSSGGGGSTDWSDLTNFNSLTNATLPLAGTEEVAIVQGGETKKVAASEFGGAEQSFVFSQRNVRLSSTLTGGNWYGFTANTNFQQASFPTNYGASILGIAEFTLRTMNGFVIDGLTYKKLNFITVYDHATGTGIDYEIQVWKYDVQTVSLGTAVNMRLICHHNPGVLQNSNLAFTKTLANDFEDTPSGYLSKYVIFLKTNAGTSFIYPSIDWNFKL
jgi:hypothetical protein